MKKPSMKPVAKAAGPAKQTVKPVAKAPAAAKSKPRHDHGITGPSVTEEKRWKTEDAMRTLMRAEELKKDKPLMRDVENLAKEQAQKLSGLCGKAK